MSMACSKQFADVLLKHLMQSQMLIKLGDQLVSSFTQCVELHNFWSPRCRWKLLRKTLMCSLSLQLHMIHRHLQWVLQRCRHREKRGLPNSLRSTWWLSDKYSMLQIFKQKASWPERLEISSNRRVTVPGGVLANESLLVWRQRSPLRCKYTSFLGHCESNGWKSWGSEAATGRVLANEAFLAWRQRSPWSCWCTSWIGPLEYEDWESWESEEPLQPFWPLYHLIPSYTQFRRKEPPLWQRICEAFRCISRDRTTTNSFSAFSTLWEGLWQEGAAAHPGRLSCHGPLLLSECGPWDESEGWLGLHVSSFESFWQMPSRWHPIQTKQIHFK